MDKKETKQRIESLKKLINYHRYLYHVLDKAEISDEALDSLKKELFDLEQNFPEFVTVDSPTQRVGGTPLKEFKKINHSERMLSFNDTFSKEDMRNWLERISKLLTDREKEKIDFYCELKIDGLAIELIYENGVLVTGATRGDGSIGEDITLNLKTVEAIPLSLLTTNYSLPTSLVVRGEVFISRKEFNAINEIQKKRGLPLYANPRNIAAGSVRQLDPKITASRHLDSFAYELITNLGQKTHEDKHDILKDFGFKINIYNKYCKTLEDVFSFYEKCAKLRDGLEYEIDGVVVIVNNNEIFEKLGVVGKAPRGAVAFKFAQSQATTIVEDIKIQVGRTGALTPVAVLKPVQVGGITISRATLHNDDEIKRLGLKIGDSVIVGRAGDVIPNIIKVLPELRTGNEKNFVMPKDCPSCKTKLEKSETEALWRCPNTRCFARQRRSFYHFVSRGAFNIEGLGPKIIDRLLDEGLISDQADLFNLKEGDLLVLERFAEKSAENVIQSIAEKKELPLGRFIYALGIRNIGQETAMDLANYFGSLETLKNVPLEDFNAITNIGPIVAKSVHEWFLQKENKNLLDKFLTVGVKIINPKKVQQGKLSGKLFIFTGSLEAIERELAKEKVRDLGGQTTESISAKVDFVVAGNEAGSKLSKAEKLGLKVISEKEFLKLIR
ncbi:MAG: NAD-dependent DNA ligase LigA [Candidatus Staskawiczbacteria bacterium]|nr:NAD-dependent DNA ligase LigA [Candidatus Staskawiczbacteria bacterium]